MTVRHQIVFNEHIYNLIINNLSKVGYTKNLQRITDNNIVILLLNLFTSLVDMWYDIMKFFFRIKVKINYND